MSGDLEALEAELAELLRPYRDRLEMNKLYGIDVLHRPGARAHDWFAGLRPAKGGAKLMLLPIKDHPEILDRASPALLARRSGEALFTLKPGDEALLPELATVLARAFDVYAIGESASATSTPSTSG